MTLPQSISHRSTFVFEISIPAALADFAMLTGPSCHCAASGGPKPLLIMIMNLQCIAAKRLARLCAPTRRSEYRCCIFFYRFRHQPLRWRTDRDRSSQVDRKKLTGCSCDSLHATLPARIRVAAARSKTLPRACLVSQLKHLTRVKPETREAIGLGGQGVGEMNGRSPSSVRDPGRRGAHRLPLWKRWDTPIRPSGRGCNVTTP